MSKRDYKLLLQDILDSIIKIEKYIEGLTYEDYCSKDIVIDAVIRNLEVIGEASTHIPSEIKNKSPDIPWAKMKSMRNIMIHEYFGIDQETIWKTITESLLDLKENLTIIM